MSIARAFTTRRVKQSLELRDAAESLQRSNTTTSKASRDPVSSIRNKISAPVELISTTNMLSYTAPDLYPKPASLSSNSTKSDDDSESAHGSSSSSTASSPPTSPDSPRPIKRSVSPEPNHLSCYFTAPGQVVTPSAVAEAPAIPLRASSHVRKSYEPLTRHRSNSRLSEQSSAQSSRTVSSKSSFSFSRSSSTSTATTATSHVSGTFSNKPASIVAASGAPPVSHRKDPSMSHPFGHELAKVSELAEEFGQKANNSRAMVEEERELHRRGLNKLSAEDYLSEIQAIMSSIFADETTPDRPIWI